jgi:hypothetical protein
VPEQVIPCISFIDHNFGWSLFRPWDARVRRFLRKSVDFNILPHDFCRGVGKVIRDNLSMKTGQTLSNGKIDDRTDFTRGISLA